jgi:small subunit ribosomal protein S3
MKGEVYGKRELSPLVGLEKQGGKSGGQRGKSRRRK